MQRINRIGQVYGMLTVIDQYWGNDIGYCVFKCECGNVITRRAYNFIYGGNQNCGCVRKTNPKISRCRHPLYNIWKSIRQRCYSPNCAAYPYYGGRGISMSDEWFNSFETFCEDMGPRPEGMTLDRIDNNGNYCKENCRWATWIVQANNQRGTKVIVELEGVEYTLRELSEMSGIDCRVINRRYHVLGWRGTDLIKPYTKHKKHKHRCK